MRPHRLPTAVTRKPTARRPTSTYNHKVKGLRCICKHSAGHSNNPNYAKGEVVTLLCALLGPDRAPAIAMAQGDAGLPFLFGIGGKPPLSVLRRPR